LEVCKSHSLGFIRQDAESITDKSPGFQSGEPNKTETCVHPEGMRELVENTSWPKYE
jgi:hypothetical protein